MNDRRLALFGMLPLLLLMQSGKRPIGPNNAPTCNRVVFVVEPVDLTQYKFRLLVRNNSSEPVVLPRRVVLWWDLSRQTHQGWNSRGGGARVLIEPERDPIKIGIRNDYNTVLEAPDLWGDERTPHPSGRYRVTFSLFPIQTASPSSCIAHAAQIVFVEPPPEKRH